MKIMLYLLCVALMCSCSTLSRHAELVHIDARGTASAGGTWIVTPVAMSGMVDEWNGRIPVTKTVFHGDIGWAIDYHLMFIARSTDRGKTWQTVDPKPSDPMMPWGLCVVSADCVWVWGTYTDETAWNGVPNIVLVTYDAGKTWRGIPRLVDWLYDVEVSSDNRATVIGRVRPKNWPEYSDPLTLPVSRFVTTDGGKTFKRL